MRVICWNSQGLKKPQVVPEVKFLIKSQKPDIMFLIETMINDVNVQKILPTFCFDQFDYVPPINHSGGIAVMWNNDNVHVSVLSKDSRSIHLLVYDIRLQKTSVIFGLYGPAQKRDKHSFWDKLIELNTVIDLPWCLIGDLNEILSPDEKLGGLLPNSDRFHFLPKFLAS